MYKCWKCNGKKSVLSLGCMFKECDECKGIGYTKEYVKPLAPQGVSQSLPVDDELIMDTSVIDTTTSIQAIEYKKKSKPRQKRNVTDSNVMASDILNQV